ncbi:MAG: 5'-methylthioadenosine/adenosylhomocysteine nucleosidase [Eubacteriales bacterium]
MVGLIGAMPEEVSSLVANLTDAVSEKVAGVTYTRGFLAGKEVVVARAGVGKVNAALCACTMALLYHPTLLLNTGVAGALGEGVQQGDVVIATSLVQHDMDTTPLGDPPGLLTVGGENLVELVPSQKVVETLALAAEKEGVTPHFGMIASGDRFVANAAQKKEILSRFPALACEMEGAAVAHAAYAAGIPFAVLRVLSDDADGAAPACYPVFVKSAAKKSQEIVLSFLALYEE